MVSVKVRIKVKVRVRVKVKVRVRGRGRVRVRVRVSLTCSSHCGLLCQPEFSGLGQPPALRCAHSAVAEVCFQSARGASALSVKGASAQQHSLKPPTSPGSYL